jgi:hypothetical protein
MGVYISGLGTHHLKVSVIEASLCKLRCFDGSAHHFVHETSIFVDSANGESALSFRFSIGIVDRMVTKISPQSSV